MPTRTKSDFYRFSGVDALLTVVGLVGFFCFALFIAPLHPDSSAAYLMSGDEAVERARDVLAGSGFASDNLLVSAQLERDEDVLYDVQHMLGRREAVKFLSSPVSEPIPAYHWRVQFLRQQDGADNGARFAPAKAVYVIRLSQSGKLVSFSRPEGGRSDDPDTDGSGMAGSGSTRPGSGSEHIRRDAIAHALATSDVAPDSVIRLLNAIPDSTLRTHLAFDFDGSGPGYDVLSLSEGTAVIDSSGIMRLADFYLSQTALSSLSWSFNEDKAIRGSGTRRAQFSLQSDTPLAGQHILVDVSFTTTGTLLSMSVAYEPEVERHTAVATSMTFIRVGVYAVLIIVFIVLFFRRMIARLIDFRSAGIDALIIGIAFSSIWLLSRQGMYEGLYWPTWAMTLLRLVVFSFVGLLTSLFVFILSGITDSLARDRFPSKIRTLTLLRHGQLQNASVGSGLLRGILVGGALLGTLTLMLWLFDGAIPKQIQFMMSDALYRPIAGDLLGGFAATYMQILILATGFGLVSYGSRGRVWAVVTAIVLGSVLMQLAPVGMVMTWEGMVFNAVAGVILGMVFLKWDLFTLIMALFSSALLWSQKEGLLIAGAESWIDGLLAILFLISLVIFGVLGLITGEKSRTVKEYVPEYVTEMAGQERVKRELEIAYQVQASFLPRSMPRISSLDLAGMCLPANEVGGDYYDYIELDERHLAVVIGDVSGKGIHASFFMTLVKGILQSAARISRSPAEVLRQLNHLFFINVPSGTFITLIYGVIDIKTGTFTFARAGHNLAILLRAGDHARDDRSGEAARMEPVFLQPAGMAVGFVDRGLFDSGLQEQTVQLNPGDMVVLYTDGFSEAMNTRRELYGDERLASKAAHFGSTRSATAMLRLLTEDVHHFIEGMGRMDDMTMMVIKWKADA